MPWIVYLIRLLASLIMLAVGVSMAAGSATGTKSAGLMLGMGAVFGLAGFFSWPRRPNAWRRDAPTDRQIAYARDLGIRIPKGVTKGQLSDMIARAVQARDAE